MVSILAPKPKNVCVWGGVQCGVWCVYGGVGGWYMCGLCRGNVGNRWGGVVCDGCVECVCVLTHTSMCVKCYCTPLQLKSGEEMSSVLLDGLTYYRWGKTTSNNFKPSSNNLKPSWIWFSHKFLALSWNHGHFPVLGLGKFKAYVGLWWMNGFLDEL